MGEHISVTIIRLVISSMESYMLFFMLNGSLMLREKSSVGKPVVKNSEFGCIIKRRNVGEGKRRINLRMN